MYNTSLLAKWSFSGIVKKTNKNNTIIVFVFFLDKKYVSKIIHQPGIHEEGSHSSQIVIKLVMYEMQ